MQCAKVKVKAEIWIGLMEKAVRDNIRCHTHVAMTSEAFLVVSSQLVLLYIVQFFIYILSCIASAY